MGAAVRPGVQQGGLQVGGGAGGVAAATLSGEKGRVAGGVAACGVGGQSLALPPRLDAPQHDGTAHDAQDKAAPDPAGSAEEVRGVGHGHHCRTLPRLGAKAGATDRWSALTQQ